MHNDDTFWGADPYDVGPLDPDVHYVYDLRGRPCRFPAAESGAPVRCPRCGDRIATDGDYSACCDAPFRDVDGPDTLPGYLWARVAYRTGSVSEGAWLSATAYSILYPLSSLGRVQVFDGDAGDWRDVVPPSDPDT